MLIVAIILSGTSAAAKEELRLGSFDKRNRLGKSNQITAQSNEHGRKLHDSREDLVPYETNYYTIFSTFVSYGGNVSSSLAVEDNDASPGNKVVLGSYEQCEEDLAGSAACLWRLDKQGMIHSALNDTLCMQVGFNGVVRNDTRIRIDLCDSSNDGQKFEWTGPTLDGSFNPGPITPKDRADLCFRHAGAIAVAGGPIIVDFCEKRAEDYGVYLDVRYTYGGRYCPGGYGGDFCLHEYECYMCQTYFDDDNADDDYGHYMGGGLCLDGSIEGLAGKIADLDLSLLESTCEKVIQANGRQCGEESCETENFCVDCSNFLGYKMTGFQCLDEDADPYDLDYCLTINGF